MVGAANLFRKRHLGVDHLPGLRFRQASARDESLELELRRTGHDHDSIAQGFTAGFI
jgi:hypothetical protein